MKTLDQYIAEQMNDPAFAAAYRELQPEMEIAQALGDARAANHLTDEELSARTGIAPAQIRRIENGNANPSVRMLRRIADGMGMNLRISFEPRQPRGFQPAQ